MAKAEYDLQPNETIIIRSENVYRGNMSGELILTNLNLVHITTKGVFKTTYIPQRFPTNQIKIFNGKAQALLGKNGVMDVYFINGQESFRFYNSDTLFSEKKAEKEAMNWVNAINHLVTGADIIFEESVNTVSVGAEMVAGVLGDTVGAFKDALGFKSKKTSTDVVDKVAKKCSFCGAAISGNKGQIIRCLYCNADQLL